MKMQANIQEFRGSMCQSLIVAGTTDAAKIINTVKELETYVFGPQGTQVTVHIETNEKRDLRKALLKEELDKDFKVDEKPTDTEQSNQARDEIQDASPIMITREEVKNALFAVAKKSRSDVQKILNKFNAANISAIDESDFAEVIQIAEQVLETVDA